MKKRVNLILILMLILGLVILFFGVRFTGRVTQGNSEIQVVRYVEGNNVKLGITSYENVIAIQEDFSSDACGVLDYSINPEIDIFEYKPSERTWVLATRDLGLVAEIEYTFGISLESQGSDWCNGADMNKDGKVDAADSATLNLNYCVLCTNKTSEEGDTDGDGDVDAADLATLNLNWNPLGSPQCGENSKGDWCSGADINRDSRVDLSDLGILADNYCVNCTNKTREQGDVDGDGNIDDDDKNILTENWGDTGCGEIVAIDCEVTGGRYFIISEDGLEDSAIEEDPCLGADINQDGSVEDGDLNLFLINLGKSCDDDFLWCAGSDINRDGKVDLSDLGILADNYCVNCTNKTREQGDIDGDGNIDDDDKNIMTAHWGETRCGENQGSDWCSGADFDKNGAVDSADLATLNLNYCVLCTNKTSEEGDTDGDGDVDAADLATLNLNWNPLGSPQCGSDYDLCVKSDINGDGKVDDSDHNILLTNFGKTGCLTSEEAVSDSTTAPATTSSGSSSSGGGGGGSSGSSGGSTGGLKAEEIVQVDTSEEYDGIFKLAAQKVSGQSGGEVRTSSFVFFIVLIAGVIAIITFLVISVVRKPHD